MAEDMTSAVDKCLLVLRALSRPEKHRVSGVVQGSGLNKATAIRILGTLERHGFIERTADRGIRFGPEALVMAASVSRQPQLRHLVAPSLHRLAIETGDSCVLLVPVGQDLVCIQRADGTFPMRASYFQEGRRIPLGAGSPGIAWLAALPDPEANAILRANSDRIAAIVRPRAQDLDAAIHSARRCGYAISTTMLFQATGGISAVVRDRHARPIAVLTVSALVERLLENKEEIVDALLNEVRTLQTEIAALPAGWP